MKTILWLYCSLFCLFFLLVNGIFISSHQLQEDVFEYHCYATIFWQGQLPPNKEEQLICREVFGNNYQFHRFAIPQEYPLLSIAVFSLPLMLPFSYIINFELLILLTLCAFLFYLFHAKKKTSLLIFLLFMTLGLSSVVFNRFDLLPGLFTLFAIISAEKKRFRWSYVFLTIAVCLKIYPIIFLPLIFWYEQSQVKQKKPSLRKIQGKNKVASVIPAKAGIQKKSSTGSWITPRVLAFQKRRKSRMTNILISLCFISFYFLLSYIIDPQHAFSPFFFQATRPLQIESIPATLFWLLSAGKVCINYSFGSQNLFQFINDHCIVNSLENTISIFFSLLSFLGIIGVYILFYKRKLSLLDAGIMLIFTLLVTNKIFSPQYLLWLAPMLAYATHQFSLKSFWWLLIFSLTGIIFPFLYEVLVHSPNLLLFTILVRNTLLVGLYCYTMYCYIVSRSR